MNKNLFIYSFKYLAVLLALVTFSSCERDEFTQQDAFDLQQAQLDAQAAREQSALAAQDERVMNMAMFRRSMDSLTRLNSGGKVFYTVNVVPGGSSAFSSGRFEEVEGLDGATVTVSQLGGAVVEQKTTVAGIASFEMYSGEVTVNVEAPNHTDLNYTANLTPDGGVPNGSLIYVGNVVPVFDDPNNPSAEALAGDTFATVSGLAFAELDITFGNNVEEAVPNDTKVRAFIDVANPAFKTKYIDQANDEGVNNGGQPTRSGFIQRFAYEEAASTTGTTVAEPVGNNNATDFPEEGGAYSISIGATASGLPITMKFDDFAAQRTYFFGGAGSDLDQGGGANSPFGIGSKRFLYTQNTQGAAANQATGGANGPGDAAPTSIGFVGDQDIFSAFLRVNFSLVTNEATATAALTGGDAVQSVTVTDGGYYYVAPTVTFSAPPAGGTTATGTAVLGALPAATAGEPAELTAARARGLKRVTGVTIGSGGSGYTANPTVTFTRFSYTERAADGLPVANGTGSVQAASSTIKYIRIINGGFGMNGLPTGFAVATTPVTGVGKYTGVAPAVVFNNNVAPGNVGTNRATANTIVDDVVGTATEIQITDGGNGYSDANLAITFNYGENSTVTTTAGVTDPALFVATAGGELRWNTAAGGTRSLTTATAGNEVTFTTGSNYTFVPSVTVTGLTVPAGATAPTLNATVVNGQVTRIDIDGATSGWTAGEHTGSVTVSANPGGVAISAEGFTEGGSIDSYTFNGNYGTPVGIYKSSVEAANATFDYITANAAGDILANNAGAPLTTNAQYSAASDFVFVFFNPTTGTSNAWGFPIFDNGGNNVVGLKFANGTGQGIGYTTIPADGVPFWILPNEIASTPNAHLAKYAQLDTNPANDANANATAARTAQNLTITFTDGGLGYAMRPSFSVIGGQRSAEDLVAVNSAINGVRGNLNFNSAGTITTPSVSVPLAANTFTDAGLAAEPLTVTVSIAALEAKYNREANFATSGNTGFVGGITPTTDGDVDINAPGGWIYSSTGAGTNQGPLAMFNAMESNTTDFTAADRLGSAGANANFKYITPPTYTISWLGADTGGNGVAVLDPATADIIALSATNNGGLPAVAGSIGVTRFSVATNDPSYPAAGERFRTIGGPSNFEVFSGLSYIRDVNYGTGIELE